MIGTAVVANALSLAAAQPVQMRGVVLDNVRIIDGSGAAPIESGRIVIERDRIARIRRAAEIRVPAGAETVDLSGRTVIPGFIDLHSWSVVSRRSRRSPRRRQQPQRFCIAATNSAASVRVSAQISSSCAGNRTAM